MILHHAEIKPIDDFGNDFLIIMSPFGAAKSKLIKLQKQPALTKRAAFILSAFYLKFMTFCLGIVWCLLNSFNARETKTAPESGDVRQ